MKASFNVDSFYNTWPLRQHNICILIQVHIPSRYSIRDFNVFIKLIYCSCYFLGLSGSSSRQNQSNSSHLISSYVTLRRGLGSSAAKVSKDNKLDKLRVCLFLKACLFVFCESCFNLMFNYVFVFVFNMICLQTDTTGKISHYNFLPVLSLGLWTICVSSRNRFFASVSRQIDFSFAFTTSAILLFGFVSILFSATFDLSYWSRPRSSNVSSLTDIFGSVDEKKLSWLGPVSTVWGRMISQSMILVG